MSDSNFKTGTADATLEVTANAVLANVQNPGVSTTLLEMQTSAASLSLSEPAVGFGAVTVQTGSAALYAGDSSGLLSQLAVTAGGSGQGEIIIGLPAMPLQTIGAFGATPVVQPAVIGARDGNAALASLLTALASLGWIIDNTTA